MRICIVLFPSISTRNWNDVYVQTLLYSSLENHIWFQTKMDKVYTLFQIEAAQIPYSLGRYISTYMDYI